MGFLFSRFLYKEIAYDDFIRFTEIIKKSKLDDIRIVIEKNITELSIEESAEYLTTGLFEISQLKIQLHENPFETAEGKIDANYSLNSSGLKIQLSHWGEKLIYQLKKALMFMKSK